MRWILPILLLATIGDVTSPAQAQTTYYVSPAGSGTSCTLGDPCAISYAETQVAAGDTVELAAGMYRDNIRPDAYGGGVNSRITFRGASMASTIINGADTINTVDRGIWKQVVSQNRYATPFPGHLNQITQTGGEVALELVIANDSLLALNKDGDETNLAAGEFYLTGAVGSRDSIHVRLWDDSDPDAAEMEFAQRHNLFYHSSQTTGANNCGATVNGYYRVERMTFQYAPNRTQRHGICGYHGSVYDSILVRHMGGTGMSVRGDSVTVSNSFFNFNTNEGLGAARGPSGDDSRWLTFQNIVMRGNNSWNLFPNFHSVAKFVNVDSSIVDNWKAYNNQGAGLWLDFNNMYNVIKNSYFEGNVGRGLFIEYESDSNLVVNNIFAGTTYQSDTRPGAGLHVYSSDYNLIAHNVFMLNDGGNWINQRNAGDDSSSTHNRFYNNLYVDNMVHATRGADTGNSRQLQLSGNGSAIADDSTQNRTNVFDGNAYWDQSYYGATNSRVAMFYFQSDNGNKSTHSLTVWQDSVKSDDNSFVVSRASPHVEDTTDTVDGWKLAAMSQMAETGVTVPSGWWDALWSTHGGTDYFGTARPATSPDIGAHQITVGGGGGGGGFFEGAWGGAVGSVSGTDTLSIVATSDSSFYYDASEGKIAWKEITGTDSLTVKVVDIDSDWTWYTGGGIFICETTDADSRCATYYLGFPNDSTQTGRWRIAQRQTTGGQVVILGGVDADVGIYLRLSRNGDVITPWYSTDGISYSVMQLFEGGDATISLSSLPSTIYVGMWCSSFSGSNSTRMRFVPQ